MCCSTCEKTDASVKLWKCIQNGRSWSIVRYFAAQAQCASASSGACWTAASLTACTAKLDDMTCRPSKCGVKELNIKTVRNKPLCQAACKVSGFEAQAAKAC